MFLSCYVVELLGLPRCVSLLLDLMILQYSVGRLEKEISVSAEEASNWSNSDELRSAFGDDEDSRIRRLKEEYGWGNPHGDDPEFESFFNNYQNCDENRCKNDGICSKEEKNDVHCDCLYFTWGRQCEQKLESRDSTPCCIGKCDWYDGRVNLTKSGRTCQRWDANLPHRHNYRPERYRHSKARLEHNYCRNPSGHSSTWCYTTDPNKRWEECDTSFCRSYPPLTNQRNMRMLRTELWLAAHKLKSFHYDTENKKDYIVSRESGKFTTVDDAMGWMRSLLKRGYSVLNAADKTARYYAGLPMNGELKGF